MVSRAKYQNAAFHIDGETLEVVPGASITVYTAGTTTPLPEPIYANVVGGTVKGNPFTADANGNIEFYLTEPKRVKLVATATVDGVPYTMTADHEPVHGDPNDFLTVGEIAANPIEAQGDLLVGGPDGITVDNLPLGARGTALFSYGSRPVWDTALIRSIVTNGAFTVPRSVVGTTDNSFIAPRWRGLMELANAWQFTRETVDVPAVGSKTAMKMTVGSQPNAKGGIFQAIPYVDTLPLRGKTLSLQFSMRATTSRISDVRALVLQTIPSFTPDAISGDPIVAWGAPGVTPTFIANMFNMNPSGNLTPTQSWATATVEGLAVSASAINLAVFIYCEDISTSTGDALLVTDVDLQEGTVAGPPDAQRDVDIQRQVEWFYREINPPDGAAVANGFAFGAGVFGAPTSTMLVSRYFPIMRVVPTASYTAATNFRVINVNGTLVPLTTLSTYGAASRESLTMSGGVASGLNVGAAVTLFGSGSNARITLDADL